MNRSTRPNGGDGVIHGIANFELPSRGRLSVVVENDRIIESELSRDIEIRREPGVSLLLQCKTVKLNLADACKGLDKQTKAVYAEMTSDERVLIYVMYYGPQHVNLVFVRRLCRQ